MLGLLGVAAATFGACGSEERTFESDVKQREDGGTESECCTDPTDPCGWRGDALCDIGCAWGLDPDCESGGGFCGDGVCDIARGESCLSCGDDCCTGEGGAGGGLGGVGGGGGPGGVGAGGVGAGGVGAGGVGAGGSGGCTPPFGGTCVTSPQCGCPAGQTCDQVDPDTGRTGCIPVGTVPPYNACQNDGECTFGHACISQACKELCNGSSCSFGGVCYQVKNFGNPVPGYFACARNCNPVSPQAPAPGQHPCGPNLHCFFGDAGTLCTGPSNPSGTLGASCSDNSHCAPGHLCAKNSNGVEECVPLCPRNPTFETCPSGYVCSSFAEQTFVGGVEIGYCF